MSAGAGSVAALLTMKSARGLFPAGHSP
ncbi:hypothetical protein GA0115255_115598, partial [Streptomyces sp. Ncost-T6T-2b]